MCHMLGERKKVAGQLYMEQTSIGLMDGLHLVFYHWTEILHFRNIISKSHFNPQGQQLPHHQGCLYKQQRKNNVSIRMMRGRIVWSNPKQSEPCLVPFRKLYKEVRPENCHILWHLFWNFYCCGFDEAAGLFTTFLVRCHLSLRENFNQQTPELAHLPNKLHQKPAVKLPPVWFWQVKPLTLLSLWVPIPLQYP